MLLMCSRKVVRPQLPEAGCDQALRVGLPSLVATSESPWQVGDQVEPGQADKAIDHARGQVGLTELHTRQSSHQVELEKADQTPIEGANSRQREGNGIESLLHRNYSSSTRNRNHQDKPILQIYICQERSEDEFGAAPRREFALRC